MSTLPEGVSALEVADVGLVDEHVHEAVDVAVGVEQLGPEAGMSAPGSAPGPRSPGTSSSFCPPAEDRRTGGMRMAHAEPSSQARTPKAGGRRARGPDAPAGRRGAVGEAEQRPRAS